MEQLLKAALAAAVDAAVALAGGAAIFALTVVLGSEWPL